jgi:sigma-E factor negative regulatory protein RseB
MANSKAQRFVALAVLLMIGQGAFAQQSTQPANARQWLDSMSSAMRSLDYDGTFVYYHDGKLEAMRIVHQANSAGEKERLMSLTGSAREVLRDDKVVTCIMPDNKSVMVGQSRPRQPYPDVPEDLDSLSPHYKLSDAGNDRVAGMMARIIAITPRDRYRYGYRFWIDTSNHMLLRFELHDEEGNAIEQVMFTGLQVGDGISAKDLEPSLSGEGYNWFRQESGGGNPAVPAALPQWTVGQLPAGFEMKDNQRKRVRQGGEHAEHLVYSDGLATVSVYVEKLMDGTRSYTGSSSMGAMNAYGTVVDGHQVTVVGEVPSATVQGMAQSVARRQ